MARYVPGRLGRRGLVFGVPALSLPALAAAAAHAADAPAILVAGPPGGRLDRWAEPLSVALGHSMPSRAPLARHYRGGLDGVTGANAFEARDEPDGTTALLFPGAAVLSWLTGEARAKFDPARWLPLWAATGPVVLVSRFSLRPGFALRVGAAAGPAGPELPALLAMDLLGAGPVLTAPAEADAVVISAAALAPGETLATALEAAAARGMHPVFTLAPAGPDGDVQRDPVLPTVPTAAELVRPVAAPALFAALRAASLAVQLEAGLVLSPLTPAASVANWRRACQLSLARSTAIPDAGRASTRFLAAPALTAWLGQVAGEPASLLALRGWLADRQGWVPG